MRASSSNLLRVVEGARVLDLHELCREPSLSAKLSAVEAAAILVELAALQAALTTRAQVPDTKPRPDVQAEGDRFLTIEEAARTLSLPKSWLYRRSKTLPFARKFGGNLRFSERGLRAWAANQRT